MNRDEFERIERDARTRRAVQLRRLAGLAMQAVARWLGRDGSGAGKPGAASRPDLAHAERFMGLASFQDRLKNSRPPRIAVIRSISSGLSE
jgi:hypothetical protein